MPPLIRMQDDMTRVRIFLEGFLQHRSHQVKVGGLGHGITHDLPVEQVQDRREIHLLAKHLEFSDIRGPLPVRLGGFEIAFQSIGSHFPNLSPVRTISLQAQPAGEVLFCHQFHHQFMVGWIAALVQGQGYPAITIPPLMLGADLADHQPFMLVLLRLGEPFLVVVVSASGDVRNSQKQRQRIFPP